jgi:NitT/TauT family transport system substrate-binding protein
LLALTAGCSDRRPRSEPRAAPPAAESAPAPVAVDVLVPRKGHLQYMSFYLALGAGLFAAEGLEVRPVYPPAPREAKEWFRSGSAPVAVLPPPMCLELIAERFDFVVFANLLANDPIAMLVRKSIAEQRGLSASAPLAERLRGLRGLRVGVSPNPPTRLRKLFALAGLDADRDIEIVVIQGETHNQVFADGAVDALYVHTPFLERALVGQDVVMLIDQPAGEVAELAGRQIHTLAATRAFADAHPEVVVGLAKGIVGAGRLIRRDPRAAVAALARAVEGRSEAELETIVRVYAPAIPDPPTVAAAGFAAALDYYPATRTPPDLTGIDLERYVAAGPVAAAVQQLAGAGDRATAPAR